MDYKVTYEGDLRTRSTHLQSNEVVVTDAPVDNHGNGRYFSPTDLVASALTSCMMTLIGITAANHQISIEGMKAQVTKKMASNPRRIEAIGIILEVKSQHLTDRQRELLYKAAINCPVAKSLHPDLRQEVRINFSV